MSRKRKTPRSAPPTPEKDFGKRAFNLTTRAIELTKELQDNRETPEKLGLSPEQAQDLHLTLQASALGLLTVLSVISGHPDPREVILKGELP